jgi:hypothetical protein
MCGLGRIAGSTAEMSALPCGLSNLVDRSKRGHASRDAPAPNGRDFVFCLDAFAGRPLGGGTNAFENLNRQRYGDVAIILGRAQRCKSLHQGRSDLAQGVFCVTLPRDESCRLRETPGCIAILRARQIDV